MKLSEYAKKVGITYRTAFIHWQKGYIKGYKLPTGTIVVTEDVLGGDKTDTRVVLYARVSSAQNKSNLDTQLERLRSYASTKGYTIVKEVKEVGSGLSDDRPLLLQAFEKSDWDAIIVERKDRLTKVGFNYIQSLLKSQNKSVEVINEVSENTQD